MPVGSKAVSPGKINMITQCDLNSGLFEKGAGIMQRMLRFSDFLIAVIILWSAVSFPAWGNAANPYAKRVLTAIKLASSYHQMTESEAVVRTGVDYKKKLYLDLANKIESHSDWVHLPFPVVSTEAWIDNARLIAKGLKPGINYQVVKPKQDAVIGVDKKIADALYQNVKMIAWYRAAISDQIEDEDAEGSGALVSLIDEFLDRLARSLPKTKIVSVGKMNQSYQHKIQLQDFVIWEILATINRCFFYKTQLFNEASEFEKADFLLIEAMTKTAILYGAKPPSNALVQIRADLTSESLGWRKSAYIALDSWRKVEQGKASAAVNFVNLRIPLKPKPVKNKPSPKSNGFPDNVTDIKEVGGKIFVKRNGAWQLWK